MPVPFNFFLLLHYTEHHHKFLPQANCNNLCANFNHDYKGLKTIKVLGFG